MRNTVKFLLPVFASLVLSQACSARVEEYRIEKVAEYPHDTGSYTQGLFFYGGTLYETTGQYGESSIRTVDLATGKALRKLDFAERYFAEGSAVLDGKLYVLTWTNRVAYVYDAATLEYEKAYSYPREGWGLTTDAHSLYASDGSSRIYVLDASLNLQRSLDVRLDGRPVRNLNELEWIDGKIWANVYLTDMIVIINPEDGTVEAIVDCSGLLPDALRGPRTDVLNGIAYDPRDGKIYLTGKYWPRLYEVRLTTGS